MNDNTDLLSNLNENINYDLKTSVPMLFKNEEWPNPYVNVHIDSKFYDYDSFIDKFSNFQHPVFMSINVQSLMSKHENFKNLVLNLIQSHVPIYVIAVQEVWDLQCTDTIQIPGFSFVHQRRRAGRGGGVGFY
jgi:hypothetical protein